MTRKELALFSVIFGCADELTKYLCQWMGGTKKKPDILSGLIENSENIFLKTSVSLLRNI